MPINFRTITQKPTSSTKKSETAQGQGTFSTKIHTSQAPTSTPSRGIVSPDVLMSLATDVKNGVIDKNEANNRFVSAVVDSSLEKQLSEKEREMVTKKIADFFSDDPEFVNKLQKNLRDLT